MKAYGDTSFLLKLLVQEPGTATAVALYRSLGRPELIYVPLHQLEAENAIRQKAFQQRRSLPSSQRKDIARERDAAFRLLKKYLQRGAFVETAVQFESAFEIARHLSDRHTERLGCRGFDLLHVAIALELKCDAFLTCDQNQAALARAEGIKLVGEPRE